MVKTYEFGSYRLEVLTRRLLRGGESISLTPKAFDTLVTLIERRDRVVDKAELMRLVWPDSFVEEANLTQTIFVLRKTLGEGPNGDPFIDTAPRRGYRFAADVREEVAKPAVADAPTEWRARARWIAAAAVALAVIGWFGASRTRWWRAAGSPIESLVVLPLENLSGDAEQAYLADGMTDALITSLSRISDLRVIAHLGDDVQERPQDVARDRARAECRRRRGGHRAAFGRTRAAEPQTDPGLDRANAVGADLRARPAGRRGIAE